MNSGKYLLFYMELFCDMFESVLECYVLTHISWSLSAGVMQEWACIVTPLVVLSKAPIGAYVVVFQLLTFLNLHFIMEWLLQSHFS